MGAVIRRHAAHFDSECDARAHPELIGMNLAEQPGADASLQNLATLLGIEGASLTEHVDEA